MVERLPELSLNQAVTADLTFVFLTSPSLILHSRDAQVMHAQIETPAFAGVSLAGHKPDSSPQRASDRHFSLTMRFRLGRRFREVAPDGVPVMHP